jgi:hypothetical protein
MWTLTGPVYSRRWLILACECSVTVDGKKIFVFLLVASVAVGVVGVGVTQCGGNSLVRSAFHVLYVGSSEGRDKCYNRVCMQSSHGTDISWATEDMSICFCTHTHSLTYSSLHYCHKRSTSSSHLST